MTKTIEIKIECKGKSNGTLGWFNSMMKDAELVVKNTKRGTPAMFLKAKNKSGDVVYNWVCGKYNASEHGADYLVTNDGFAYLQAEANYMEYGFSEYPLTPACKLKVEEMIQKAVDQYREWWDEN